MALQKSFDDTHGVTHASAYWRLLGWFITVDGNWSVRLGVYHDAAARSAGKTPIVVKEYPEMMSEDTLPDLAAVLTGLHGDTGTGTYLYTQLKANVTELDGATDV